MKNYLLRINKKIYGIDTVIFLKNVLLVLVIANILAFIFSKGLYLLTIHFLTVLILGLSLIMLYKKKDKEKIEENESEFVEE
ncbi:hypothetical protein [Aliarcobacter skirrowii]|uniref:hypothetical protein n=1 Tax=Aliarcobacter skirrowii TaxID=28200 RepID=UPI000832FE66|nr:hypothetical protein [Aliarcobacter skirrowii]